MSDVPERQFEVDVRPGFLVTMAAMVATYSVFHAFVIRRLGSPISAAESLNWGASATMLILLGTVVHELGHVVAGMAAGHRWTRAVLNGAGLGVVIEPRPHGWQRVFRSLAGPVAQFLFSVPLLVVAMTSSPTGRLTVLAAESSIWWVSGVSNLFLAVLNALPIPGFDGAKVVAGFRELLQRSRA